MKGTEIVTEFLGKVSYPIDKNKLVEAAHNFRMGDDVIRTVEGLPNQVFGSLEDVIPHLSSGAGLGGVGKKVGNVIRGTSETSENVRNSTNHGVFEPGHPELDALAKTRRKPSKAEGEREFDEDRGVNRLSEDEGRSQST